MIVYRQGDILEAGTEAIVNTVNCVGVMGRGIALQFKHAFPDNFAAYASACQRGEVQPGKVFVFETQRVTPPRFIINFPTKPSVPPGIDPLALARCDPDTGSDFGNDLKLRSADAD